MDSQKIGYYSVGPDMMHVSDTSQMKYVRKVSNNEFPFDLNMRLVKCAQYYQTEFNAFLKYLEENRKLLDRDSASRPFVCTSALEIFSVQGPLHITARLYDGVIYLRAEEVNYPFSATDIEASEMTTSWHLKFQQFMQSDLADGKRATKRLALGIEQFCIVYQSTIQHRHTVIHSQSVSGVNAEGENAFKGIDKSEILLELDKMDIVSCHTTLHLKNEQQKKMYREFTTQKFWMNAVVCGVEEIVLGHRNADGILKYIEKTTPKHMIEVGEDYWSPHNCVQQIDDILSRIHNAFSSKTSIYYDQHKIYTMFFKKTAIKFFEVPASEASRFPKIDFV